MNNTANYNIKPDQLGYFGKFGGNYLTEEIKNEFLKIEKAFNEAINSADFQKELNYLLKHYAGRPSPVSYAKNLSEKYGAEIYLKRED